MFKWPMMAAVAVLALGLQPAAARAQAKVQETETVFAIPSPTLVFTAHFVARDAGFFQKEGLLDPKDALTGFDDLFADEFVK